MAKKIIFASRYMPLALNKQPPAFVSAQTSAFVTASGQAKSGPGKHSPDQPSRKTRKKNMKQINMFFLNNIEFRFDSTLKVSVRFPFEIDRKCFNLVELRSCNSLERRPLQGLFYQLKFFPFVRQKHKRK